MTSASLNCSTEAPKTQERRSTGRNLPMISARNFSDENGKAKIDAELHAMLLSLLGSEAEATWRLLKAPITWASYAVRKE